MILDKKVYVLIYKCVSKILNDIYQSFNFFVVVSSYGDLCFSVAGDIECAAGAADGE